MPFGTYQTYNVIKIDNTNPQNANGRTIRGMRLPRNVFISQLRPRDNAPASIKNKATPILKHKAIMSFKNHDLDKKG